jgi:hypothetical protein
VSFTTMHATQFLKGLEKILLDERECMICMLQAPSAEEHRYHAAEAWQDRTRRELQHPATRLRR